MNKINWLKNGWLTALLLAGAGAAHADMQTLPYSDSVLIEGTYLGVVELNVDLPGTYKVTATDLNWFDTPLQALSFGMFTSTGAIATLQNAGSFEFEAAAGKLFLQLYAQAGGSRNVGLVGLDVIPTAVVPLPAPVVLLGGALPIWFLLMRRRAHRVAGGGLVAA